MMDCWWKVWSRLQKWYEPLGLSPMPNGALQFSVCTSPWPLFLLRVCTIYQLTPSPQTFCAEGLKDTGHEGGEAP